MRRCRGLTVVAVVAFLAACTSAAPIAGGPRSGQPNSGQPLGGHATPSAPSAPPTSSAVLPSPPFGPIRPDPGSGRTDHVLSAARVGPRDVWAIAANLWGGRCGDAGCPSQLYRSSDGGHTWQVLPRPSGSLRSATIEFANRRDGWILEMAHTEAASGQLYATRDGGVDWHRQFGSSVVASIAAAGGSIWVATGRRAPFELYRSAVGRASFRKVAGGLAASTLAVRGASAYVYAGVATFGRAGRWVTVVSPSGVTRRDLPCPQTFQDAMTVLPGGALLLVCGDEPGAGNQIKVAYRSDDGGRRWLRVGVPLLGGSVGELAVGVSGVFGAGARSVLSVSRNGGRTWATAVTGSSSAAGFSEVAFADPWDGLAIDSMGVERGGPPSDLYLTADGGHSWHLAAMP
jgi:photosystem II stability/assembly factor-like uncharacterized protein